MSSPVIGSRMRRGARGRRAGAAGALVVAVLLGGVAPPAGAEEVRASVRPGSWIQEKPDDTGNLRSNCTAGFVLQGDDGNRYLFVAGHCARNDNPRDPAEHTTFEEEVFYDDDPKTQDVPTMGIYDGETQLRLGFTVYTLDGYRLQEQRRVDDPTHPRRQSPVGADIGLVRLDPGVVADPQMCFWGGPTGMYQERSDTPVTVRLFNNGTMGQPRLGNPPVWRGYTVPAKTAVLPHSRHPDFAHALAANLPGDSGSPVITADGKAVGVINVGAAVLQDGVVSAGPTYVMRIGPALRWMERRVGVKLKLLRAPLIEQPTGTLVGRQECR